MVFVDNKYFREHSVAAAALRVPAATSFLDTIYLNVANVEDAPGPPAAGSPLRYDKASRPQL